jgi:uncharacterized protein
MGLKEQINQDLKTAMLAGDKTLTTTLRGLKSSILDAEISKGVRETGLSEQEITDILAKEAKKRQESVELYVQGGNQEKADAELAEKEVISKYLPKQLSEQEISELVNQAVDELGNDPANMGKIIGQVKAATKGAADGALIAKLVKEKLSI